MLPLTLPQARGIVPQCTKSCYKVLKGIGQGKFPGEKCYSWYIPSPAQNSGLLPVLLSADFFSGEPNGDHLPLMDFQLRLLFWIPALTYEGVLLTGEMHFASREQIATLGFLGALLGFLLACMFTIRQHRREKLRLKTLKAFS